MKRELIQWRSYDWNAAIIRDL